MSVPAERVTTLQRLSRQSDLFFAFLVVSVVAMILIPLPTFLLNILLTINITLALVILILTMYATDPLSFAVFPSLIILTTVFRLALNISTTRSILANADAGEVIDVFGSFVVGGNYVVGLVIFLIIVIVNYMVISHGAVRIGEVAARFTLDAMPGKQMAIDADLNAGLINEEQARERRRRLEREADFFGAMDGAARFAQRDAVAGLLITAVNMLAGLAIGILQRGMDAATAAQTYTRLTVGDGLVAALPALMISVATGLIVTNATSTDYLGKELTSQVFSNPKPILVGAIALFIFAVTPGLPKLPFFAISALAYALWAALQRGEAQMRKEEEKEAKKVAPKPPESVVGLLHLDLLELEIGYGLIPLVDLQQGGDLLDRVTMMRRQIALELGLVVPPIRIRDNMQLAPNAYQIKLKGVPIARGEVEPAQFMAMHPGEAPEEIPGTETKEPTYGLKAYWIHPSVKDRAEALGYTVVDATSVIITHLSETIKSHAPEILTRQDVQTLLDNLKQTHAAVVDECVPGQLSLGEVQKVLQNLLRERVPVRDLLTIMEVLSDQSKSVKDTDLLTEYVRQALSRTICKLYTGPDDVLRVFTLQPNLEQALSEKVETTAQGRQLFVEPARAQKLVDAIALQAEKQAEKGQIPVLLVSAPLRLPLKRFLLSLPQVAVLSYNEIHESVKVESTGQVSIE